MESLFPIPYSLFLTKNLNFLFLFLFPFLFLFSSHCFAICQFTFLHPHSFFCFSESETLLCQSLFQSLGDIASLPLLPLSYLTATKQFLLRQLLLSSNVSFSSCVSLPLAKSPFYSLNRLRFTVLARRPALQASSLSNSSSLAWRPLCTVEWTLSSPPERPQPMCI